MNTVNIMPFKKHYQQQVVDLIVGIQSGEFGVNITAQDQPDLFIINDYYQQGQGNFWVALQGDLVIGCISLFDIHNNKVALRKMFVNKQHRGQPLNIGQRLMDTAIDWCKQRKIKEIFLGTVPHYYAAHRFYQKNGFKAMDIKDLPVNFNIMEVDTCFYYLKLHQ